MVISTSMPLSTRISQHRMAWLRISLGPWKDAAMMPACLLKAVFSTTWPTIWMALREKFTACLEMQATRCAPIYRRACRGWICLPVPSFWQQDEHCEASSRVVVWSGLLGVVISGHAQTAEASPAACCTAFYRGSPANQRQDQFFMWLGGVRNYR